MSAFGRAGRPGHSGLERQECALLGLGVPAGRQRLAEAGNFREDPSTGRLLPTRAPIRLDRLYIAVVA